MTVREWVESDPEPDDVDAVVDPDGITWTLDRDGDFIEGWHQQLITHHPVPAGAPPDARGAITGGSCFNDWHDIFGSLPLGSSVREATAEEARTVAVRFPPERHDDNGTEEGRDW